MRYIVTIQYPNCPLAELDITWNLTSTSWKHLKLSFDSNISGYNLTSLHDNIKVILEGKGIITKEAKILALEVYN